jgi:hypothetical protein
MGLQDHHEGDRLMNTKIEQRRPIPAGVTTPVHHNSGSMRSTPAGGEVSPDQYRLPASSPAPDPKK